MKNNNLVLIIALAAVFGFASGIVGEIVTRVYILEDAFGIPLFGEINYGANGSSLIIREPKKVVIEQNTMVAEAAKGIAGSLVGIHGKLAVANDGKTALNYYDLEKYSGQGLIMTSDGWIMTSFLPEGINPSAKDFDQAKASAAVKAGFVIIDSNRQIYEVQSAIFDKATGFSFWQIKAKDLPVRKFIFKDDLKSGASVMGVSTKGWIWQSTITGVNRNPDALVESSDNCHSEIVLADNPSVVFSGSFLFNLNGDVIGILGSNNKLKPILDFTGTINSILKTGNIKKASLGVNYINLTSVASPVDKYEKGALISADKNSVAIEKGSAAEKAGLKSGDIILEVNGSEINAGNDLCDLIAGMKGGDEIVLKYMRNGESKEVKIILGNK